MRRWLAAPRLVIADEFTLLPKLARNLGQRPRFAHQGAGDDGGKPGAGVRGPADAENVHYTPKELVAWIQKRLNHCNFIRVWGLTSFWGLFWVKLRFGVVGRY